MQGLLSVLQDATISLLSRVRQFTPLLGGPAFFLPLFTQVRGRGVLRTSPVRNSRKFGHKKGRGKCLNPGPMCRDGRWAERPPPAITPYHKKLRMFQSVADCARMRLL